jgi:hypothetical protein
MDKNHLTDIEFDEIIVNLKVISSLLINEKLLTSGSILNVDKQNTYIPNNIRRWIRGDNRDESIKKIDRVIIKCASYMLNPQYRNIMQPSLETCIIGLQNLKETYSSCVQTIARIENLIIKVQNIKDNVDSTKKNDKNNL